MIKQLIKVVFLWLVIVLALVASAKVKADDCPLLDKPEPHPTTERVEIPAELLIEPEPEPETIPQKVTSIFADGESAETVTIDGAELIFLGVWDVTEYCPCRICNGGYTGTASGNALTPGRTVACNSLPIGAEIYIEGYGLRVVEDRGGGGACWVDILVETHEDAMSVEGSSRRKVWVKK